MKNKLLIGLVSMGLMQVSMAGSNWDIEITEDIMDDTKTVLAKSKGVKSINPMVEPFNNVEASLVYGCNPKEEWAYVNFDNSIVVLNNSIYKSDWEEEYFFDYDRPNMKRPDGSDMIHEYSYSRIRWDDDLSKIRLRQDDDGNRLYFMNNKKAIDNILKSSQMILETNWERNGITHFKVDVKGSSDAIRIARLTCGFTPKLAKQPVAWFNLEDQGVAKTKYNHSKNDESAYFRLHYKCSKGAVDADTGLPVNERGVGFRIHAVGLETLDETIPTIISFDNKLGYNVNLNRYHYTYTFPNDEEEKKFIEQIKNKRIVKLTLDINNKEYIIVQNLTNARNIFNKADKFCEKS